MPYPDLDDARSYHAALREIFERSAAAADQRVLRRVQMLCQQAAVAVDDAYCSQEIRLVSDYAAELFSKARHEKYESQSLSGAEFLRLQILKALDSFHSRLYSLEAMRRSLQLKEPRPIAERRDA